MTALPAPGTMLGRGARLRCPRCGGGGLFERWFRMRSACPTCELDFEREDGYWTGAVMVNLAVTEGVFIVLFLAMVLATAPDVPWTIVLVVVVAANVVVPIAFYPFSRALWLAGDLAFRRAVGEPEP